MGCMSRPVGPIGVQGHGHAVVLDHRVQGTHDGPDALAALPELGVQDALRRVVDDADQCEPLLGSQREPAMTAPVQMQ